MTFCGQCGIEIAEKDGFCTNCGRKAAAKKEQQTEQSVNNWTDLYQSTKKLSKKKPRKKVAKKEKEEKLTEYEKDYLKRLKKKPRKKAVSKEVWLGKVVDIKPQKQVSSPIQSSFSFSGSSLPTFLIAGFIIGFIMFAIIGLSPNAPPYQPPIEMDLGIPYDDGYYYSDYDYYP